MSETMISRMPTAMRRLGPVGLVSLCILTLLVLLGLFDPWLPSASFKSVGTGPRRMAPGAEYLLGTDNLGRSMLARVFEGIRITFLVSAAAVLLSGMFGMVIGMAAAYYRGAFDAVIAGFNNVLFAFPAIIFGLIVSAILGAGITSAVIAIFFVVLPTMIRVARAAAISVVNQDFVVAAQVSGASVARILLRHVAPNIAAVTVVQMAYMLSIGMIVESSLSFLGLGVQPPISSLGALLRENSAFISVAPWLVLGPGLVLSILIFCVNLLGDTARDLLAPSKPRQIV